MHEDIPTNRWKEEKQFQEGSEHNRQKRIDNNMEKEIEGLKEGFKATIYIDSLRVSRKNVANWKTTIRYGLKHLLPFTTDYKNEKMLRRNKIPEWMTKSKTTLIQNDPPPQKKNNSQRLQTPIEDEENSNNTN